MEHPEFISATEAAKALSISRNAINLLIRREVIPAMRVGGRYIIRFEDVETYRNSESWKRGQDQKERVKSIKLSNQH